MFRCATCAGGLSRVHRTRLQRLFYTDVYRCGCGRTERRTSRLTVNTPFYLSRQTRCIRCATLDVRRGTKLDRIDRVSRHPVSLLMQLLGAPINRCFACRLQYFDWRPPSRTPEVATERPERVRRSARRAHRARQRG